MACLTSPRGRREVSPAESVSLRDGVDFTYEDAAALRQLQDGEDLRAHSEAMASEAAERPEEHEVRGSKIVRVSRRVCCVSLGPSPPLPSDHK